MPANDKQVAGDHYKNDGEQLWDRIQRLQLDYFQGNIIKYVERWKKKGGVEDLHKAQHYLEKYIELNTEPISEDRFAELCQCKEQGIVTPGQVCNTCGGVVSAPQWKASVGGVDKCSNCGRRYRQHSAGSNYCPPKVET